MRTDNSYCFQHPEKILQAVPREEVVQGEGILEIIPVAQGGKCSLFASLRLWLRLPSQLAILGVLKSCVLHKRVLNISSAFNNSKKTLEESRSVLPSYTF